MFEEMHATLPPAIAEMMNPDTARAYIFAAILATPRMAAFVLIFPALTRFAISGLVRSGVVFALSIILIPSLVPVVAQTQFSPLGFALLAGKEVLIGLVFGLAFGVVFWGMEAAGNALDFQRGASVAQHIDATASTESTVMGTALGVIFACFFWVSGGFLIVLDVLFEAYRVWPILAPAPSFDEAAAIAVFGMLDGVMTICVLVGGPLMIAMFISELALALTTRFAPQLNIFILAMPIKCGVLVLFMPIYLYFLFEYFGSEVGGFRSMQGVFETVFEPIETDLLGNPAEFGDRAE